MVRPPSRSLFVYVTSTRAPWDIRLRRPPSVRKVTALLCRCLITRAGDTESLQGKHLEDGIRLHLVAEDGLVVKAPERWASDPD